MRSYVFFLKLKDDVAEIGVEILEGNVVENGWDTVVGLGDGTCHSCDGI